MVMDWATVEAPSNVLFEYVDDPEVIVVDPLKVRRLENVLEKSVGERKEGEPRRREKKMCY